ncbi:protein deglycase HchA [Muribacter muris]|uniref:Protein deglycase HchA n=1 Tax=Muribacter muris TaxID=67855 RepID=A0A4Y9JUY4_9PAST|nr:glyoxalase III HchA [Muribacter muris]MBF0785830.1 protein deglycase HchA [Muribacter muris]MBF0827087.1 protein deglycase HchA [Muribacter muris]TFV08530.1 protein deglycase HchA [Muribacter muris]
MTALNTQPVPDFAEHNAFFPSDYSLSQYTSPHTNFDGVKFKQSYTGGKYKVLMIATDERYLQMQNGKWFSTGNHPVETLLPTLHIHQAGFEIEVATLSGNHAKFEMWAMPKEDQAVATIYNTYLPKLSKPHKLADILDEVTQENSPYLAVFIPGGHGAFNKIPESREVQQILDWALKNDKFIITLCHGPAALVAAAIDRIDEDFPFKDYALCVFPDALDEGANIDIGYMPGKLPWLLAARLEQLGMKVLNKDITGQVHQDRKLLTGDSPLAANALGILAAAELLKAVGIE